MEDTQAVIVGAGPSGLTMGLALAKHGVKSIILEKSPEPDQDPRGVYLNGDAVRILWTLGLHDQHFADFAGEPEAVHFYKTCIVSPHGPFFALRTRMDFLHQALPGGVTHVQPTLEAAIASVANETGYCDIRRGCTVVSHEILKDNRLEIIYQDDRGKLYRICCNYLIGADGKRGVVRKAFLEPTTSIRQVSNPIFQYEGTWVATNLRLNLPTPDTHPDFPLWALGYSPQAVYDLFCPTAWYFCSPPGKPTAGGRFGPEGQRLWRHEFAQPDWNSSMDAEELFWEHFSPFVTRTHDKHGNRFPCGAVSYPRDCIQVLRCKSFTFTHKVLNRWFNKRRILIGDAAHVFPPFGGQGIASGIRDAHQLAWRIALLESMPSPSEVAIDKTLDRWACERRKSIDAATFQTKMNGQLCNEPETWAFYLFRNWKAIYESLPFVPQLRDPVAEMDRRGFKGVNGGFFLPEYGGGGKYPQIFIKKDDTTIGRSDEIVSELPGTLKILVLRNSATSINAAKDCIRSVSLPRGLLADCPTVLIDDDGSEGTSSASQQLLRLTTPTPAHEYDVRPGYRAEVLREWLGQSTLFAVLRSDFHIFALTKSKGELVDAMEKLQTMVSVSEPTAKL